MAIQFDKQSKLCNSFFFKVNFKINEHKTPVTA